MKAVVVVLLAALCLATAQSDVGSEARFVSTEATHGLSAASVLSDQAYAQLKHEEAAKALKALHLPGEKRDIVSELMGERDQADAEIDSVADENEAELLSMAAKAETTADEDADLAESVSALSAGDLATDDDAALEAEIQSVEDSMDENELALIEEDEEEEEDSEAD